MRQSNNNLNLSAVQGDRQIDNRSLSASSRNGQKEAFGTAGPSGDKMADSVR